MLHVTRKQPNDRSTKGIGSMWYIYIHIYIYVRIYIYREREWSLYIWHTVCKVNEPSPWPYCRNALPWFADWCHAQHMFLKHYQTCSIISFRDTLYQMSHKVQIITHCQPHRLFVMTSLHLSALSVSISGLWPCFFLLFSPTPSLSLPDLSLSLPLSLPLSPLSLSPSLSLSFPLFSSLLSFSCFLLKAQIRSYWPTFVEILCVACARLQTAYFTCL